MAEIIDGKAIASEILSGLKKQISRLGITPRLAVVMINPDERSKQYVNLKLSKAAEIGIDVTLFDWSGLDYEACAAKMRQLAGSSELNGIIVQLPTKGFEKTQKLLDLIPTPKDVDGLSSASLELLRQGKQKLIPATPKAILKIIEASSIQLTGTNILIIGQGQLVGLPLAIIMQNRGLQVQTADIKTQNLSELTKKADVIVAAAGSAGMLDGEMIKHGAIVLDAGASEANGKIVGDVDYESVEPKASVISKVPGGIGPVTVACLLENVLEATKNSQ